MWTPHLVCPHPCRTLHGTQGEDTGLGARTAVPGVADEHVGGSQPGVIPLHATRLVQHQDVGPEAISGQDSLVCDRLGRNVVDR